MAKNYLKDKFAVQVSGTTVQRFRQPTNAMIASNMTQFIFDYKNLQAVVPDNARKAFVESTQGASDFKKQNYQSINPNRKTAAFGKLSKADLGSTPDEPGRF